MKRQMRRRYFVEGGFQLRYAGIILLVAFLAALVSSLTVFFTAWNILGERLAAVYPQGVFVSTFNNVMLSLLRNMFILAIFIFVFAIVISHRIAGPTFRLKRVIHDIGEGNLDSLPVYLRKTDELHDIAEELNKIEKKLRARMKV